MSYKWKPSKSQRRAFAERMQDPKEQAEYYARKEARAEKRRARSQFDYNTAGGKYVPTKDQYNAAMDFMMTAALTDQQKSACDMVIYGYNFQEKVHHDHIHIVNELRRATIN